MATNNSTNDQMPASNWASMWTEVSHSGQIILVNLTGAEPVVVRIMRPAGKREYSRTLKVGSKRWLDAVRRARTVSQA